MADRVRRGRFAVRPARPLFFPTRHPAPVQAASVELVDARALVLVGVVLSETGRVALIARANLPGAHRVVEGEEIEGWTLATIEADRVVLRHGASEAELRQGNRGGAPHAQTIECQNNFPSTAAESSPPLPSRAASRGRIMNIALRRNNAFFR